MSAWVLVIIVMATSLSLSPFDKDVTPASQSIGILTQTNTYAPSVISIDFANEALCEAAAQKLKDSSHFGTESALCLKRN